MNRQTHGQKYGAQNANEGLKKAVKTVERFCTAYEDRRPIAVAMVFLRGRHQKENRIRYNFSLIANWLDMESLDKKQLPGKKSN